MRHTLVIEYLPLCVIVSSSSDVFGNYFSHFSTLYFLIIFVARDLRKS